MSRRNDRIDAIEDLLIEAWQLLMRSPDPERGWLASGSRSWWPAIVREKFGDYADPDEAPRLQLGRREVGLRDMVFVDTDCLALQIAPDNRALVATVLMMKSRHEVGGFRWERVWETLGGRRLGVTTDALRMRYERSLSLVGVEMARREGPGGGVPGGPCGVLDRA